MKKLIIIVIALVGLLIGAYFGYNYYSKQVTPTFTPVESNSTETAPEFTVYDTDRHAVHFKNMVGKPIIINIWASWCMPCQSELPDFQKAYEKYGDAITFMMINVAEAPGWNETVEDANACVEEKGYNFPVYYDFTGEACNAYNVDSIPRSVFIDANGNIVAEYTGAMSEEILQSYIDMLVK